MVTEVYDAELTRPRDGTYNAVSHRTTRRETRWIHDRMVIHRTGTGEVDSLSGITEDITDARRLEDQLRQAQKWKRSVDWLEAWRTTSTT